MCKRVILLASIVAVFGLVSSGWAVEYDWVGGTDNDNWCHEDNWEPTSGPPDGPDDQAGNGDTPPVQGPIIGPGCDANVGSISLPDGSVNQVMEITGGTLVCGTWRWCNSDDSTGTVTISGGDVNVHGEFRWADAIGGYGIANFTGGTFTCHSGIKLGDDGGGEMHVSGATTDLYLGKLQVPLGGDGSTFLFNMSGRLIDIDGSWSIGDSDTPGAIEINFDSGDIICNDFSVDGGDDPNSLPSSMDFEEGAVLEIRQDIKTRIQSYIDAGFITGKDDTEDPSVILVGGRTIVGFNLVQKEASGPSPLSGTGGLCPDSVTISWTPGTLCVDDHNVYFGTSEDDVNESTTPYLEHYASNSVTLTDLEVGKAYFWRVDEVNDTDGNSPWKGSVWHFSTEGGAASDPSPANNRRGLKAEDVDLLSWSTHCIADTHNLYFATDLPERIVLFDDDFETGAFDPNWTASGSWEIFDVNGDPNFDGRDANMAKVTGSGDLITADVDATEGDPCAMNISFYFRKTEEITNGEIKLYYYDGSNWDYIADLNSNPEGANDVWLHYSDTNSDSQYFVSTFKIKLEANITGGTVYIDDVTITNTWPTSAQWYEARVDVNSHPISVEPMTVYRWRVDTVIDGNVYQGPHWKFSTGYRGLLMYYKFDGTIPNPLPSPIQDDSDNDIEFYKYTDGGGSVTYGESNPVLAGSTASAEFDPNAGLYRLDPCGPSEDTRDILRLDGDYTVEMWVKPRSLPEEENAEVWLISKRGSWGLRIEGDDDLNFWYQWSWGSTDKGTVEVGEWQHIAVVYDQEDEDLSLRGIYLNGDREGDGGGLPPPDNNSPIWIGCRVLADGNLGNFFDGMIDEIRIHDIALRPCELLAFQVAPEYAICPIPYDGEGEVDPCTVELIWTPGEGMVHQELYFSSDYDDVIGGSATPVETTYSLSSWTPPSTLGDGTIYYWRVDSYDGSDWYRPTEAWRFTTVYVIEDETLLLHYKLDETAGDDAIDASGHGHHGDVDNGGNWDPDGGRFDGCLIFDSEQVIDVPEEAFIDNIGKEASVSVWVKGAYREDENNWLFSIGYEREVGEDEEDVHFGVALPDDDSSPLRPVVFQAGNEANDVLVWTTQDGADYEAWLDNWHHFVFIKNENEGTMSIWFDAQEVAFANDVDTTSLADICSNADDFKIGAKYNQTSDFIGKIDDFRLYDYALPQSKIEELYRGGDVGVAWAPVPYDGESGVPYKMVLEWRPGNYASLHQVYFGTNWDDVNSMTDPCATKDLGDESYDPCGLLELEQTYYWRVDEVNEANDDTWKGKVWRFTVADYIGIDDMEDYTEGSSSDYPITQFTGSYGWDCVFTNSTGSYLSLGLPSGGAPVRDKQSMVYVYDNSDAFYSEISNHFPMDPCDWTYADVKMLTLWFYGNTDNAADDTEQMYVGLEDHSGGSSYSEVKYPMEDMNDIKIEDWQEWNIALSDFNDDNPNLDLTDVDTLYIGFGDRNGSVHGGGGFVYFDDIRLYQSTCVLSQRPEAFAKIDFNNDCIVDFGDVEIMAEEWLKSDVNLGEVSEPCDANLVGWWMLDEGSGSTAYDSSDYHNDGTIEVIDVNVWWVAGRNDVNYALDFDDGRVLVPDGGDAAELRPMHQVSASAWIYYSEKQDSGRIVVKGADDKETYDLEVGGDDELVFLVRDGNDPNAESYPKYAAVSDEDALDRDEWIHIAGTYDGNTVKCYINGGLAATGDASDLVYLSQNTNDLAIGNRPDAMDRPFKGLIDDVRVYDYALSVEDVRYLGTDGTGFLALQSIADLVKGEPLGQGVVNLRDFAILADSWLEEKLWPE